MLVAISGGIGSGKSVVARMLGAMGYRIYDCDSRARSIIDSNRDIKLAICELLGCNCLDADGNLDRKMTGNIVFSNADKLDGLNRITHSAVRHDICQWRQLHRDGLLFVETAVLYQSGIDRMVDSVIEVNAPLELRIKRVMRRNGFTESEVSDRINSQNYAVSSPHPIIYTIINDDVQPLLPQVHSVLSDYRMFLGR